jgi:tripeptide aminopeptidase
MAMKTLLDRFCRYVRIDTQADENAGKYPSTPGQLELGRLLEEELRAVGAAGVDRDRHGIVMATIPATISRSAPTIAWIAHLDTSPETSGRGVKPIVHRDYDGKDIVLSGDPSKVLRVAENSDLAVL